MLTPSVPQSKAAPFSFTSGYKRHVFKHSLSFFLPYVPARLQFSGGYNLGSFSSHHQQMHLWVKCISLPEQKAAKVFMQKTLFSFLNPVLANGGAILANVQPTWRSSGQVVRV